MNFITIILMLFTFMLPLSKNIANVFLILAFFSMIWLVVKDRERYCFRSLLQEPLIKIVLIFLGCILITIPFSSNIWISLREYYHLLGDMGAFFVLLLLLHIRSKHAISIKYIVHSYFVGLFLACLYLFYQCYAAKQIGLSGLYSNRAFIGFILEVGIPLILSMALAENSIKNRVMYVGVFLIYTVALFLTQARGSWIGVFIGITLILYLYRSIFNKKNVLISIVMVLLFATLTTPFYLERVKTLFDPQHITNVQRIHIWQYTVEMIEEHPVFGIGMGQYPVKYPLYIHENETMIRDAPHAHNSYLMIFAEGGAVGFLAFINLLICLGLWLKVAILNHQYKKYVIGFIGLFSAVIITSFVDNAFFSPYVSKMFWLLLGIIAYSVSDGGT